MLLHYLGLLGCNSGAKGEDAMAKYNDNIERYVPTNKRTWRFFYEKMQIGATSPFYWTIYMVIF